MIDAASWKKVIQRELVGNLEVIRTAAAIDLCGFALGFRPAHPPVLKFEFLNVDPPVPLFRVKPAP